MNRNLVKSVGLRINPTLFEKIEKDALDDDVPYSMIVRRILNKHYGIKEMAEA